MERERGVSAQEAFKSQNGHLGRFVQDTVSLVHIIEMIYIILSQWPGSNPKLIECKDLEKCHL